LHPKFCANSCFVSGYIGRIKLTESEYNGKRVLHLAIWQKWTTSYPETNGKFEWHNIHVYGRMIDRCLEYGLEKGDKVVCWGAYRQARWENEKGEPRSRHYMAAFSVDPVSEKRLRPTAAIGP
jgi:single-stranded DNA-binding protein